MKDEMTILSGKNTMTAKVSSGKSRGRNEMKTIKIKGMSCNHCVMAVTKALKTVEGVDHVQISLEKGEATFDETVPVDMAVIAEKIGKAGYEVG
jgi:copper chaperone